jgi:hypothetical protein
MGKPDWENLDEFLQLDSAGGFASSALIALQGGGTLNVTGIFDDPRLTTQLGEFEHDTLDPRFACRSDQVAAVRRGDELTLDGTTYDVVASPHHDGTGLAVIKLAPR